MKKNPRRKDTLIAVGTVTAMPAGGAGKTM
jgi:hypothetical protein